MLFPFRLLVLHSSSYSFSFSSSILLLVSHTFTLSDPNRNSLLIFSPLSFNAIIKNCYCEMNFHMDVVLPWNITFHIYIWVQQRKYDKRNKNYCTRTMLEMDGEKKKLQMMWIWFVVCFGSHCKISFFLFVYVRWVGFWHSRYRRTHTHIIFFGIKWKAISSMWSETFGFINRMHGIFTLGERVHVYFFSVVISVYLLLFHFFLSLHSVHGNVRNVLACDNGLCESNMINL